MRCEFGEEVAVDLRPDVANQILLTGKENLLCAAMEISLMLFFRSAATSIVVMSGTIVVSQFIASLISWISSAESWEVRSNCHTAPAQTPAIGSHNRQDDGGRIASARPAEQTGHQRDE
jgi:hypothetical protein